jgi:hypothetical protein
MLLAGRCLKMSTFSMLKNVIIWNVIINIYLDSDALLDYSVLQVFLSIS